MFVALELETPVRTALGNVQRQLRSTARDVRWVNLNLLHVTMKFLGEVDDSTVPDIIDALDLAASECTPFTFVLDGCGCFPAGGPVRVVWGGVKETTGMLQSCAEFVEATLAEIGFEPERRAFSPHITLGRVRNDRSQGKLRDAVSEVSRESAARNPVEQLVERITLMSSTLSTTGPTYVPLHKASLGKSEHDRHSN